MKSKERIFAHIRESALLPSLPHILVKLIDACDDDNVPISAIAPIVAKDTSLSSRVLRLVNSAYFGLFRSFSNLDQAVVYLGAGTIKNLAITASVQQIFKGMKHSSSFNIGHFWYHSLLCATLGKRIAQAAKYNNIQEAYLAGLLHNIGHLILFVSFPKEYTQVQYTTADGSGNCTEEEQLIGISHCEAGSWLLKNWRISPFIADTALYHHHSAKDVQEGFPLVKIIYLANRIAELPDNGSDDLGHLGSDLFDFDMEQMRHIIEGAKDEVIKIAESLEVNIKIPADTPQQVRKNGEQHHLSETIQDDEVALVELDYKNQELAQLVENSLQLHGFLKTLIRTDGKDSILAATEEIIRILFGCETIFFLLFDAATNKLTGAASPENQYGELVQDLVLQATNSTSLAFKSLEERRIETSLRDTLEHSTNLADTQLANIIDGQGMLFVPMLAKQESIGVIVLSIPEAMEEDISNPRKQLQLIADQTAMALNLDDLQRKEARKLHSERLAVASLAAKKIAHEVNNPLGIISNYLKLLEIKLPNQADIHQELQVLDEEINRISTIINQLNNFATTTTHQAERININDLLDGLLRILVPSLLAPGDIQLHFTPDSLLTDIVTDKNTLKQIIINLVKNSTEAMRKGGTLFIKTANKVEKDIVRGIVITFGDDGPGIPEEIQAKLFSPFMTTKGHGHSGLGLSIVHRSVTDLGGTVDCKSSSAKGTRFTISLPVNLTDIDTKQRG